MYNAVEEAKAQVKEIIMGALAGSSARESSPQSRCRLFR